MATTVQIPWPLSSAPGANQQESAGRLINAYAEPLQPESGPAKVVYRRSPGVVRIATTGLHGYRGGILVSNSAYMAFGGRIILVTTSDGNFTLGPVLPGTQRVTFARNNLNPTPQIGCVTENGAFVVTSGSVTAWPDADLPQPNSISFQDGYFFFTIGDRRVFASDINSTSVNSQSFTTIQSRADDTLLRGVAYNGFMYFFCSSSIEIYQNAGASIAAPAFPYSRMTVVDRGLLGASAIAGWEQGFGQLLWVADDYGVYKFQSGGVAPLKVSPPDLDRLIKAADPTMLEASCYVHAGHSIWVLQSPDWSWEFNLNTEKWTERWSIVAGLVSQRWRASGSLRAFGAWMMGSNVSGNVLKVDDTNFYDEGDPMLFRMESGPVQNFPSRIRIARADFYFVTGVGIAGGTDNEDDPSVLISWSDDGGNKWSVPLSRKLGRQANAKKRVSITSCGSSGPQGRRWRIDVSDGVYVGFLGATMSDDPRAN